MICEKSMKRTLIRSRLRLFAIILTIFFGLLLVGGPAAGAACVFYFLRFLFSLLQDARAYFFVQGFLLP